MRPPRTSRRYLVIWSSLCTEITSLFYRLRGRLVVCKRDPQVDPRLDEVFLPPAAGRDAQHPLDDAVRDRRAERDRRKRIDVWSVDPAVLQKALDQLARLL